MPIYEYRAARQATSCARCRGGYELIEAIAAGPSSTCPECGAPVERIFSAPAIGGSRSRLDDRAKSAGFTKLRKVGQGEYEKEY